MFTQKTLSLFFPPMQSIFEGENGARNNYWMLDGFDVAGCWMLDALDVDGCL